MTHGCRVPSQQGHLVSSIQRHPQEDAADIPGPAKQSGLHGPRIRDRQGSRHAIFLVFLRWEGGSYAGSMVSDARSRAVDKVAQLSRESTDLVSFWRASTDVVTPVLPHWWTPCFFTLDPASTLVTSHFHEGLDQFPTEALVAEYYGDDVHQIVDVVRSQRGISTLHEVTGGDPSSSPRWQFNLTMGGDQELIARLRTVGGENWGAVSFYREPGAPMFDEGDLAFVERLTPHLARGARTALLVGEATDPETPDASGLLVLDAAFAVQSTTADVARWMEELPGGDSSRGRLPASVLAVAGAAFDPRSDHATNAFARVRSRTGAWVLLHGALLEGGEGRRVAVIVEPAHPARIYPLLMSAYQLTEREQAVTSQILHGSSTTQIATELNISPHTVQQHLKSVFDKTGVHSRRDLVAKIFFNHYEPRFRDNEHRVQQNQPVRGGPAREPSASGQDVAGSR